MTEIARSAKGARYTLFLLFLANLFNVADRALLGIVVDPVKADLALSDTQMSIVSGFAFVTFNLVVGVFIAHWVDHGNRKRILTLGIALWSAATALTGLAQGFTSLTLARILVGVGEATAFPVAYSMIADLFAAPRRPRAVAIFQASTFVGLIAGSILAGVIAAAHGWRMMFVTCGLAGFALVALQLVTMREPLRVEDGAVFDSRIEGGIGRSILHLARLPGFLALSLGTAFATMVGGVLPAWAPAFFLRSHDVPLAGWRTDRTGGRRGRRRWNAGLGNSGDQACTRKRERHFFGNGLVADAEIIGTSEAKKEMAGFDPKMLAGLAANYHQMGEAGEFLYETMGRKFDFSGVDEVTLPNRTFEHQLTITVGDKTVELVDLGPAHTKSDTIVWVPGDRTVFTGDLLFNEGHPIMWAGPVENWIEACRYIIDLDPEVVVPGHGPITGTAAVANMKAYFEYVRDQARLRFDAGMGFEEAARDINMTEYRGWSDPERIVANVFSLYKQWGAPFTIEQQRGLFGAMGRYHNELAAHDEACGHDH